MQVQAVKLYEVRKDTKVIGYLYEKSLSEWIIMCQNLNCIGNDRTYNTALKQLELKVK